MYQKYMIRIIVIFYLFSSFLSATHIHHDLQDHASDCQICIVVKNIQGGDASVTDEVAEKIFDFYELILLQDKLFSVSLIKGYHSQAPPLFS